MSCALRCIAITGTARDGVPLKDTNGQWLCRLCKRTVRRNQQWRRDGAGRKHNPRCPDRSDAQQSKPAAAAVAPPTRKRRAQSDPGESPEPAAPLALTRRVTPPKPAPTTKKQRTTRQEERIMRLLDETHARRMAMTKQEQ